jgi:uncharacterized protein (DUF433 family)
LEAVAELLTASEAAVVASVSLRDINRVIDEHILPRAFMRAEGGRMLEATGCALISFYFGSAKRLTADERQLVIARVGEKLLSMDLKKKFARDDWVVRDDFLTIDLGPFLRSAAERLEMLAAARAAVTVSSETLGGTPVVTGTRVPVHDVAASLECGRSPEDVLAAYPSLTRESLDPCKIYAEAYPLRGRHRMTAAPAGATVLADRRVARRKMG